MAAETLPLPNGVVANGDLGSNPNSSAAKKSRESDRRRRRRKQKKNNKASQAADPSSVYDNDAEDEDDKENNDTQQIVVKVEYVPEQAEFDDSMYEEFKQIFDRFNFHEAAGTEEDDKKDESALNAALSKKSDSDSEEEEQDNQQKEKGVSNKKKKLQRRMKIAELKQICSRPDVVEVWDATAADPKLLVFLKSYRNSVPVPRHWCQKRKFLQGSGCDNLGAWTCRCLAMGTLK